MKNVINKSLSRINQLSNRTKYIAIFLVWSATGLYVIDFFLAGQGDSLGLLPIAYLMYFTLWLVGGGILALGLYAYKKVNKLLSVVLLLVSIVVLQPLLSRFSDTASYRLYQIAVSYNIVTADSLIEQLRNGVLPGSKIWDIGTLLIRNKDASSYNVEWLLAHCLIEENNCYVTLEGLFVSGLATKEQIIRAYENLKKGSNNVCYKVKTLYSSEIPWIIYKLTPIEILYDLRNYCSGDDLEYLNWRIKCLESPERIVSTIDNKFLCSLIDKSVSKNNENK